MVCQGTHKNTITANQEVCVRGKSTHATQVDLSFASPRELAGQLIQHGASTLPGLAEVRAALPPAPVVL